MREEIIPETMLCFEDRKCVKIFTCCNNEDDTSVPTEEVKKIEIIHTQNSTVLPGKKSVVTSDSDSNSDSGVGSVRDSSNDSGKESIQSKNIPLKIAANQQIKNAPKVNRAKSVKRSESLLSRFSFIFPSGGEKLSDILVEEFKKNDRTTGIALERMFSSNSMNSIPEESINRPTEAPKKQLKKQKKSLKQLITGKDPLDGARLPKVEENEDKNQKNESTPDVPTTPEMDLENREKKKRKKRRFQRKNIDAEESESSSSTSSSNRGKERPVIRKPSQKVAESK